MNTLETPVIHCAGCGKTAARKPEYAGRRVRCKCGHVIEVGRQSATATTAAAAWPAPPRARHAPATAQVAVPRPAPPDPRADPDPVIGLAPLPEPPAAVGRRAKDEEEDDENDRGAYGLAPMPAIPIKRSAQGRAAAAAALAVAVPAGAGGPASPIVGYAGFVRKRDDEEVAQLAEYQRQNLFLPAVLIAVGLLATFAEARLAIGQTHLLLMSGYVALSTIVNLVLIFAALLITSKLLDLGLGEVAPALLKIAAVAILPSAVGGIIREATGGFGGLLAWAVSLGCYFALLYFLFDMDVQEMMICTTIIWVIRTWVGYFIFMAIITSVSGQDLSGGAAGPGAGGGGPAGGTGGPAWVAPAGPGNAGNAAAPKDADMIDEDDEDAPANPGGPGKKVGAGDGGTGGTGGVQASPEEADLP